MASQAKNKLMERGEKLEVGGQICETNGFLFHLS